MTMSNCGGGLACEQSHQPVQLPVHLPSSHSVTVPSLAVYLDSCNVPSLAHRSPKRTDIAATAGHMQYSTLHPHHPHGESHTQHTRTLGTDLDPGGGGV